MSWFRKTELLEYKLQAFEFLSENADRNVLITAGVDGDEYTGIQAAYKIVEILKEQNFPFNITVIPVVNDLGFRQGVSYNPADKKFPKHVFPGSRNGSSTEKLIFRFVKDYVCKTNLWIDLHSGAHNEFLEPFVWSWQTGNPDVNKTVVGLLKALSANRVVYDKSNLVKVSKLASMQIPYIMLEAGQKGEVVEKDVNTHINWVKEILSFWQKDLNKEVSVFTKVESYKAVKNGIWKPAVTQGRVTKGSVLGTVNDIKNGFPEQVVARKEGTVLYGRMYSWVAKKQELICIAFDKVKAE